MTESKYQFERNLLYASESEDIEIAKTEWHIIVKETRKKQDGHCICQRNIKHVTYMYNIKTNHTISVGTKCVKKFGLNSDKYVPLGLRTVLSDFISNASYEIIDDIVEYSDNVEDKVIEFYANKISNTSVLIILVNLQIEIEYLIAEYHIQYLDNVLIAINNKIQTVKHDEQVKKEQIAAEIKCKQELKKVEELKQKNAEIESKKSTNKHHKLDIDSHKIMVDTNNIIILWNRKLENDRIEEERLEKERLEKERLEKERLEKERDIYNRMQEHYRNLRLHTFTCSKCKIKKECYCGYGNTPFKHTKKNICSNCHIKL
jgi:hypothetical protein